MRDVLGFKVQATQSPVALFQLSGRLVQFQGCAELERRFERIHFVVATPELTRFDILLGRKQAVQYDLSGSGKGQEINTENDGNGMYQRLIVSRSPICDPA